ncbi:hypothetical protein M231_06050 [Tremella mesenterica]|uniref:Uncharacterized protein n=1 Tax=Tremella mesenterica TaxID=5217 RepID=A0A4Q1BGI0_TREME|nr:hypothetical protein M231_06050 [Tremella mesenterica]
MPYHSEEDLRLSSFSRASSPLSAAPSINSRASSPLSDAPPSSPEQMIVTPLDDEELSDLPPSDDEFEEPRPAKKRKTGKRQSTSKTLVVKVKGKEKGKAKGKSSGRKANEDDVSDAEDRVSHKKGVLLAYKPEWHDLQNLAWEDDEPSPLYRLPAEVLDRCFGAKSGLGFRDFISLAGVNKFFRNALDDRFFKVVSHASSILCGQQCEICKERHFGDRPFSHVRDCYTPKPPPQRWINRQPTHYIPRGPRASWTRAQYTVYKEEQSVWRQTIKAEEADLAKVMAKHAKACRRDAKASVKVNYYNRRVLAVIDGRLNGEPAVEKDDRRMPVSQGLRTPSTGAGSSAMANAMGSQGSEERETESPDVVKVELDAPTISVSIPDTEPWVVPDTDDEDLDFVPMITYDDCGDPEVHDFWPSKHRRIVAKLVNEPRISKTEAMRQFKVTEAELITLRHVLVPNPMNGKQPQQIFMRAAVEALAYRSHGGAAGHLAHLARAKARADKALETRRKNGTIQKKRKIGCSCPVIKDLLGYSFRDHRWW